MKFPVRTLLSFTLVTLVACGKSGGDADTSGGGPAPVAKASAASGKNGCDTVANKLSIARNKSLALGGKLPQFGAKVAEACTANAWSDAVRTCLVTAAGDAAAKACVEGDAASTQIIADVNKALADAGLTSTW